MQPFFCINKKRTHERIAVLSIDNDAVLYLVMGADKKAFREMTLAELKKGWLFGGLYA